MASVSENMAYLAGLLDGEGCVTYKKYWDRKRKDRPRKYFCWRIQMEIVMTHKPTIQWCADTFGGKVYEKPRKEHKMQYRWRRSFRDALEIAKAIIPHSITKKDALQKIIDHYDDGEYQSGGAYRAMLKLFRENLKNENSKK
jgi:hypothetical protein